MTVERIFVVDAGSDSEVGVIALAAVMFMVPLIILILFFTMLPGFLKSRYVMLVTCMGALFLVVGLVAAFRRVPEYPYWVQKAWKNYQKQGEHYTYCFTEQGIEVHTGTSSHRYDYVHLQQL